MKFSVICPTTNNQSSTVDFLLRVVKDFPLNFDLTIVYQGSLSISSASAVNVQLLNFDSPIGLSNARNLGAKNATGDFLLFLDDDLLFECSTKEFFLYLSSLVSVNSFDACSFSLYDFNGSRLGGGRTGFLSYKHFSSFMGAIILIKKDVFCKYSFDNSFGVGAIYPACEETDLFFRLLDGKYSVYCFESTCLILHPILSESAWKAFKYRKATGALLFFTILRRRESLVKGSYPLIKLFLGELIISLNPFNYLFKNSNLIFNLCRSSGFIFGFFSAAFSSSFRSLSTPSV